jgi:hypothetical protein
MRRSDPQAVSPQLAHFYICPSHGVACIERQTVTYASIRLERVSNVTDTMLAATEHQELEECLRLLAVYCAEFRSIHGNRSFDTAMNLLAVDSPDDAQAIVLADGYELIVAILGFIRDARRPSQ